MKTVMSIQRRRLRSVIPYADGTANPLLWFAFHGSEPIVLGTKTRRECELAVDLWRDGERRSSAVG